MKRKFLSIISILIMLVGTLFALTGCGTTKDNMPSENNNNNSSNIVENNENTSNITKNNNTTSTTQSTKKNYYEIYGKKFYYPDTFKQDYIPSGFQVTKVFSGMSSTNETIYYFVAQYSDYTKDHHADFSTSELPDILADYVKKIIINGKRKYDSYDSKYSVKAQNNSTVSVNGTTFLKSIGSIHTETNENSADLTYVAYYGIFDFSNYSTNFDKVPTVIMTFSEANDEKTIKEMDESITYTLENLK